MKEQAVRSWVGSLCCGRSCWRVEAGKLKKLRSQAARLRTCLVFLRPCKEALACFCTLYWNTGTGIESAQLQEQKSAQDSSGRDLVTSSASPPPLSCCCSPYFTRLVSFQTTRTVWPFFFQRDRSRVFGRERTDLGASYLIEGLWRLVLCLPSKHSPAQPNHHQPHPPPTTHHGPRKSSSPLYQLDLTDVISPSHQVNVDAEQEKRCVLAAFLPCRSSY